MTLEEWALAYLLRFGRLTDMPPDTNFLLEAAKDLGVQHSIGWGDFGLAMDALELIRNELERQENEHNEHTRRQRRREDSDRQVRPAPTTPDNSGDDTG